MNDGKSWFNICTFVYVLYDLNSLSDQGGFLSFGDFICHPYIDKPQVLEILEDYVFYLLTAGYIQMCDVRDIVADLDHLLSIHCSSVWDVVVYSQSSHTKFSKIFHLFCNFNNIGTFYLGRSDI